MSRQQQENVDGVYSNDGGKTWGYVLDLGPQLNGHCTSCNSTFWIATTRRDYCSQCGGRLTFGTSPRERRVRPAHRTKAAALRARRTAQASLRTRVRAVPRMTVGRFLLCEWLPTMQAEVEPTTWKSLKGQIEQHIVPIIGHISLLQLSRDHIRDMYQELLCKPKCHGEGFLSKSSVQRIHAGLHWALESLVEAGRLPANPADGAKPRTRKSEMYEIKIWSPDQLQQFLSFVRSDPLFPLWRLLAWSGMRRGEALGLQWRDLQLKAGSLSVRRAVCAAGSHVYVSRPKSTVARVVDLDRETLTSLRAHKRRQARAFGPNLHDCWIFTDAEGNNLHPNRVTKSFTALVERSGLPRIRLHDLRHTHASHLIMSGANIKVVQERLGHANATITLMTYTHLMPTTQRTAIDTLARSKSPG
jgi:integrase